ncbi:MAG TPA: PA2169 family four-helix-bundle protein [Pricia sp.]|nr:PA2169 family four-helix-bundle protein [Pricia sp.]
MSTYTEQVGEKLNDLLENTYDAERGFKKAADKVEDGHLKRYFADKAQERYDFGHALKSEIKQFSQKVDVGDSLTGRAHRSWMDIKSLFSLDDGEAMLEEAIKGEKKAIEAYDEILTETSLPDSTQALLQQQRNKIDTGLMNIKSLEDIA